MFVNMKNHTLTKKSAGNPADREGVMFVLLHLRSCRFCRSRRNRRIRTQRRMLFA